MRKLQTRLIVFCALAGFTTGFAVAQADSGKAQSAASTASASKPSSTSLPSAADISAAKAAGKVWVNLNSGVYHKSGRWYGKTKNGKFMSEDEAKKAGYTAAHRD
jgi:hypothetical protein